VPAHFGHKLRRHPDRLRDAFKDRRDAAGM
jgi:hypothetical protein